LKISPPAHTPSSLPLLPPPLRRSGETAKASEAETRVAALEAELAAERETSAQSQAKAAAEAVQAAVAKLVRIHRGYMPIWDRIGHPLTCEERAMQTINDSTL
jgi:hypothetical protein